MKTEKLKGVPLYDVDIESLIVNHPDVDTIVVVDMPNPELGERVCVCIQRKYRAK